ncbi:unnamed protein product, partial [Amoebophrya sp. A25]
RPTTTLAAGGRAVLLDEEEDLQAGDPRLAVKYEPGGGLPQQREDEGGQQFLDRPAPARERLEEIPEDEPSRFYRSRWGGVMNVNTGRDKSRGQVDTRRPDNALDAADQEDGSRHEDLDLPQKIHHDVAEGA